MLARLGRPAGDDIRPEDSLSEADMSKWGWWKKLDSFAEELEDMRCNRRIISRRTYFEIELQLGWASGSGPRDPLDLELRHWNYDAVAQLCRTEARNGGLGVEEIAEGWVWLGSYGNEESLDDLDGDDNLQNMGLDDDDDDDDDDENDDEDDDGCEWELAQDVHGLQALTRRLIEEHQEDIVRDPTPRLDRIRGFLNEDWLNRTVIQETHNLLWRRLLLVYGSFEPSLARERLYQAIHDPSPACPFGPPSWGAFLHDVAQERETWARACGVQACGVRHRPLLYPHWALDESCNDHRRRERELARANSDFLRLGCHRTLLAHIVQFEQASHGVMACCDTAVAATEVPLVSLETAADKTGVMLDGYRLYTAAGNYAALAAMTGRDLAYLRGVCPPQHEAAMRAAIKKLQGVYFDDVRLLDPAPSNGCDGDGDIEPSFAYTLREAVDPQRREGITPRAAFLRELARASEPARLTGGVLTDPRTGEPATGLNGGMNVAFSDPPAENELTGRERATLASMRAEREFLARNGIVAFTEDGDFSVPHDDEDTQFLSVPDGLTEGFPRIWDRVRSAIDASVMLVELVTALDGAGLGEI